MRCAHAVIQVHLFPEKVSDAPVEFAIAKVVTIEMGDFGNRAMGLALNNMGRHHKRLAVGWRSWSRLRHLVTCNKLERSVYGFHQALNECAPFVVSGDPDRLEIVDVPDRTTGIWLEYHNDMRAREYASYPKMLGLDNAALKADELAVAADLCERHGLDKVAAALRGTAAELDS